MYMAVLGASSNARRAQMLVPCQGRLAGPQVLDHKRSESVVNAEAGPYNAHSAHLRTARAPGVS
jgi:hypothetical protein